MKVLFLVNHDVVIYNFRLELVERLLQEGHEVHVSSPYGERIDDLLAMGIVFHPIALARHGMNPLRELQLLHAYKTLLGKIRPDICLGFTIKPNLYGAIAARHWKIPFVANITGLGTAVEKPGLRRLLLVALYKYAFRNIQRVFFQNDANRMFFSRNRIALGKHSLLPGSGVSLARFPYHAYPPSPPVKFAFLGRIMKEKGIDEYLMAAEFLKTRCPHAEFHVCGFMEEGYRGRLQELHDQGIVQYHGMIRDVAGFMEQMHCIVLPTYYPEGISNVLLEACATGRPVIATDWVGCREVVVDGVNGFLVQRQDSRDLIDKIEHFLHLSWGEREAMGKAGRHKVEQEFDREIVIQKYQEEIARVN